MKIKEMSIGSICLDCKYFNVGDRVRNCPDANSIIEFEINHRLNLIVAGCKGFNLRLPDVEVLDEYRR